MVSVKYPPSAARALANLRGKINDIEIYVEDLANPNVWLYYIKQHLDDSISLNNVNIIGSRNSVISACKIDQDIRPEKRLYIIDGDIDIILGKNKPRIKHLYRLRSYCIENMLIDEELLINAAMMSNVKISRNNAKSSIKYSEFENLANSSLMSLFIIYAMIISLGIPEKTVSLKGNNLLVTKRNRVEFCPKKIFRRSLQLIRKAKSFNSASEISLEIKKIRNIVETRNITYKEAVSAKDYTLIFMYINLQKIFGYKGTFEQFKVFLAMQKEVRKDLYLKRRLTTILK